MEKQFKEGDFLSINNMKNQFIPYELAVKLKELWFDEECLACFFCCFKMILFSNKYFTCMVAIATSVTFAKWAYYFIINKLLFHNYASSVLIIPTTLTNAPTIINLYPNKAIPPVNVAR